MMAITDTDNEESLEFEKIESKTALGVKLAECNVVFARAADLEKISFATEGTKNTKYYVMGLSKGEWRVTVDGKSFATLSSKDGENMVIFDAPCGEITLEKVI